LPLHWNSTSNVVWKTEIPGEGWSSPIVFGDRVFVTTTTDSGVSCRVISLERKTGKVIWDKNVFEQVPRRKESKNSYSTPTPIADGKRVYAVFGDGSIVALSYDGSIAWTNREVKFYSRHGLGASPVSHRNLLIMPFDGSNPIGAPGNYPQVSNEERLGWQIPWDKSFIAAVDVESGKRVWTAQRGMSRIAHVSPLILKVEGKDQLISGAGDRLQGFDLNRGELIWSVYAQGEGVAPSPVAGDGLIFASSGFEKTTLRAVRLGGANGDVTQTHIAWEQTKGVPTLSSLLYVKPYLYAITDGGIATCYKGESGEIVYQERVGGNHSASPVYAGGKIYFLSEAGETTVIEPGPEFKIRARNPLNETCQASIAVSQKQLFIRSDKNLFCIGTGAK
jgi:outer membrane protein assembly factor BamB